MPPDYGAIGYHWKGRTWFANLYIWHRGPWRLSWCVFDRIGVIELPIVRGALWVGVTDVLWGLKRRGMEGAK